MKVKVRLHQRSSFVSLVLWAVLCFVNHPIASSGESREIARKGMVVALSQLRIEGEIRTTFEYVMNLLERPGACIHLLLFDWFFSPILILWLGVGAQTRSFLRVFFVFLIVARFPLFVLFLFCFVLLFCLALLRFLFGENST